MKPKYKEVNLLITVPKGKYCWEYLPPYALCEHFSNEGGCSRCDLGFYPLETKDREGVLKPKVCGRLK